MLFETSLIEIHSNYAWDFEKVMRAMEFAHKNGMTGLAFHRTDYVDQLLYPTKYIGGPKEKELYSNLTEAYDQVYRTMYKYDPTRRDNPYKKGLYFRRVLHEAKKRNLEIYIENKEINYLDCMDELYPFLRKNGAVCPSEPFLLEYVNFKYRELFATFPDIAGIITSTATGESKTSFASNRCNCELCQKKKASDWHKDVIMAMYEPIHAAGKKLIIRDFVFDSTAHKDISEAMDQLPKDIIFSLKNTPHDYYPTFPHNPRIGKMPGRQQWIEYDTMGQYYGQGIGVSIMAEDIRYRFRFAKENGVSGLLVRTDWEGIDGHAVFETPNLLNLFLVAQTNRDLNAPAEEAYDRWLCYRKFYADNISIPERRQAIQQVMNVYGNTFEILRRTAYVHDCVFTDSSEFPASIEHGMWLAEEKNSLKDWLPSKATALDVENVENLKSILREKDQALELIRQAVKSADDLGDGLNSEGKRFVRYTISCDQLYVEAYRYITYGIFLTRYFMLPKEKRKREDELWAKPLLENALNGLTEMSRKLNELFETTEYYYMVYVVLDGERVATVRENLCKHLAQTDYDEIGRV